VFPPPQKRLTTDRRQSECSLPITLGIPLAETLKRDLSLHDPVEAARAEELDAWAEFTRIKAVTARLQAQQHKDLAALEERRRKIVQNIKSKMDEYFQNGLTAYNSHVEAKTRRKKLEHESKIIDLC